MNKKILFLILSFCILLLPIIVSAQQGAGVQAMINNVKNLTFNIGLAIVTIGWVVAGILYLTSGGSPEKMGTAKKAMIAAAIGTVLILFASAGINIYNAILDALTKGI